MPMQARRTQPIVIRHVRRRLARREAAINLGSVADMFCMTGSCRNQITPDFKEKLAPIFYGIVLQIQDVITGRNNFARNIPLSFARIGFVCLNSKRRPRRHLPFTPDNKLQCATARRDPDPASERPKNFAIGGRLGTELFFRRHAMLLGNICSWGI